MKILSNCTKIILLIILIAGCETQHKTNDNSGNFPIKLEQNPIEKRVDVTVNGKLFTSLLYADTLEKPVLFPIVAANGVTITRGYPLLSTPGDRIDHPHHMGFWFTYWDV